jgi:hypothetical protein
MFQLFNTVTPAKAGAELATSCALKKPIPGLRRDDGLSDATQVFVSYKTQLKRFLILYPRKRGSVFEI